MIHFPERVQKLRVASSLELKTILELETMVQNDRLQEQLIRIKSWLGDIEKFFLLHVLTDQMTPSIEAAWLSNAEMILKVASNQLEQVNRVIAQGDSSLETMSG